jgi:uncharacterized protein
MFDISGALRKSFFPGEERPGLSKGINSSWTDLWKLTISGSFFRFGYLFFVSRIPKVLGMFLLGMYLGRNNRYKQILNNKSLLWKIVGIGFLVGLPCNYLLAQYMKDENTYWDFKIEGFYYTIVYALGVVPMALAYAASIALIYQNAVGSKLLALLQPVGKMAFTNYILHTLISIFTFYGVGLGYGGNLGPVAWTVFALGVFLLQIVLSTFWLSVFQFGPIEWFWRSMTYGKWQPFRKKPTLDSH